jgi:hypothetical protein
MGRRFYTGNDAGTWKFRISKAGTDAKTAAATSPGLLADAAWLGSLPIHAILSVTTPGSAVSSFSVSWSALAFTPLTLIIFDRRSVYQTGYTTLNYSDFRFEQNLSYPQSYFTLVTASGATFYTNTGNFPTSRSLGDLFVFNAPAT